MIAASAIGCVPGILLMKIVDLGQIGVVNGIIQLVCCGGLSLVIIAILC